MSVDPVPGALAPPAAGGLAAARPRAALPLRRRRTLLDHATSAALLAGGLAR